MNHRGVCVCFLVLLSCQWQGNSFKSSDRYVDGEISLKWFSGGLSDRLVTAKKQGRPIFVDLIGPSNSNEICWSPQENIFLSQNVIELIAMSVPVRLQVESKEGQAILSQYVTPDCSVMQLIAASGELLFPFASSLDPFEFEEAFSIAVTRLEPFQRFLDRMVNGEPTENDWRLLSWSHWNHDFFQLVGFGKLSFLEDLIKRVPQKLDRVRAILAGHLLTRLNKRDTHGGRGFHLSSDHRQLIFERYFPFMVLNDSSIFSARRFLLFLEPDFERFLEGKEALNKQMMTSWFHSLTKIERKLGGDLFHKRVVGRARSKLVAADVR